MSEVETSASPERQKALEYLTVRAEALTATEVRARVRAAAADLEAALAGVDEAAARAPGRPGEWTIAQVADHVAQTTMRVAAELGCLLDGRRPPAPPVYAGLTSEGAHWAPWAELVEGVRAANAEVDALLGRAVAREPAAGATARTILVVNDAAGVPETFPAELGWKGYAMVQRLHLRDHRNQIRTLRARQGGRA